MKFSVIAIPLAWLIIIIGLVSFARYGVEMRDDIRQRQYDLQINYAIDGATEAMLNRTSGISTDYFTGSIEVDPRVAYQTYQIIMGCNQGPLPASYTDDVDAFTACFIVCANDGYYVYSHTPENTEYGVGYPMSMSPKIPYAYEKDNLEYLLTLPCDRVAILNPNTSANISYRDITDKGEILANRYKLTNSVQQAMNSALYAFLEGRNEVTIQIPAEATNLSGTNPIEHPTCLAITSRNEASSYAIGGANIVINPGFYAWEQNGVKFYTHAEREDIIPTGATKHWYSTAKEAAKYGYIYKEDK